MLESSLMSLMGSGHVVMAGVECFDASDDNSNFTMLPNQGIRSQNTQNTEHVVLSLVRYENTPNHTFCPFPIRQSPHPQLA